MRALFKLICLGLFAAMLLQPVLAEREDGEGRRMQGGGINYAPQPEVYVVVSTDFMSSTVRISAADGRTGDVHVDSDVYDLSNLNPGDKIRIDFRLPESENSELSAAKIWPAQ